MKQGNVLIIDDEDKLRNLMARIIRLESFDVIEAENIKVGLKKLECNAIDVVLCDVKLPDGNGIAFVTTLKAQYPHLEIIVLTAFGNIQDGVQAIKNGAFDYLVKGNDNERILPLIYRAMEKVQLKGRINELELRVGEKYSFDSILGSSAAIKYAIELATKVVATDASVLLTGETGTGKEVFAQAIHQGSQRAKKSFVALNCSAFSKEIIESELFGHKQGAFTGALRDKKGLIEQAHGGTLFLDEIGEMPIDLQAKLLRVLETNTFIKLGDTTPTAVDFRLVAATNKDLKAESEAHLFRADLYFRLNGFQIELPPLRERKKDIPVLASHFALQYAKKSKKNVLTLSKDYTDTLLQYRWPGNIRELKNIVERSVILCNSAQLTADLLPYEIQHYVDNADGSNASAGQAMSAFALSSIEKLHIQKVLNYTKGNKAEAARLLEVGIATLYRKIDAFGLHSN